jgi:hypothetical protein
MKHEISEEICMNKIYIVCRDTNKKTPEEKNDLLTKVKNKFALEWSGIAGNKETETIIILEKNDSLAFFITFKGERTTIKRQTALSNLAPEFEGWDATLYFKPSSLYWLEFSKFLREGYDILEIPKDILRMVG